MPQPQHRLQLPINNSSGAADGSKNEADRHRDYKAPEPPPRLVTQSRDRLELQAVRPPVISGDAVRLVFRVPCRHFRMVLHQLLQEVAGIIAKGECYSPANIGRWTQGLTVKIRHDAPMGGAMHAMTHRLGLLSSGPGSFCLDGFYHGAAEFGNVFGTEEPPWMLVQPGSTPSSLRLQDGDSVFMSVPTGSGGLQRGR